MVSVVSKEEVTTVEIFVDGVSKGTTPIKGLSLSAGKHRLRIENSALAHSEVIQIVIRRGKPTVINRTLSK